MRFLLLIFYSSFLLLHITRPISAARNLSPAEIKIMLRLRLLLENPPATANWTNSTNFCSLPPSPYLNISCSGVRLTELAVSGEPSSPPSMSPSFSVEALFTSLARLPNLTSLSLVNLGIWGPLPASKLARFAEIEVLNLSRNSFSGHIPPEIAEVPGLRSLVLAGNSFNGTVPDLRRLTELRELDLSENQLGPELPEFFAGGNGVTVMSLRKNRFQGAIPVGLRRFQQLESLDLSGNGLIGSIPAFLFSLPSIRYLDLSGNGFAGGLPAHLSCTAGLQYVDISGNLLTGELPPSLVDENRVVIDDGNCFSGVSGDAKNQQPSSHCIHGGPIAAVVPATGGRSSEHHLGLIFGVVAGGIVGAALLAVVIFVLLRRAAKAEHFVQKMKFKRVSIHAAPRSPAETRHMSPAVRVGAMGMAAYRVFAMDELEEATNGFDSSRLIGRGLQGEIYSGWLRDVAGEVEIRSVKLKRRISPGRLAKYIEAVSKFRHRHLISILGHCVVSGDGDEDRPAAAAGIFLVFERVSNGTLRSHLTEWRKREMMKWPQRLAAAIGVARGVQFLHTVTSPAGGIVVANDLRMENILMDETLTAKISNYNFPAPTRSSGGGKEEQGEKEDVYQLGIILLETITGKPPARTKIDMEKMKIQVQEAVSDGSPEKIRAAADPAIRGTFADESMRTAMEVALGCLAGEHRDRPSVDDVLWKLHYSVQIQDGWGSYGRH